MQPADPAEVELDALLELFFEDAYQLGQFRPVSATEVPSPSRELLAHEHHMTVTVERHHGSPVDVRVLQTRRDGSKYSREILLTRQSDDRVVQYGIVRLNLDLIDPAPRSEIESEQIPLGRILINHQILRQVRLLGLWEITAGPELAKWLPVESGQRCYGRTALIYLAGAPAIELLEIVA